uniref:Uncharacterized protein n=1 Tax=Candidatus Kentrum sp. FW TaxID=2126338 RepID=A0A450S4T2_9GAMM|nr:MAG: hypothetical protein BECKFW1821B_GA0114236_100169 [Candidatus Kentron sp. FW]VFJ48992.1 MAG: hypothetical protein BECKFW1821A_GA0114235_102127 [Candidatus Kentron sp. FW]
MVLTIILSMIERSKICVNEMSFWNMRKFLGIIMERLVNG